jgi:hypothetical protein
MSFILEELVESRVRTPFLDMDLTEDKVKQDKLVLLFSILFLFDLVDYVDGAP